MYRGKAFISWAALLVRETDPHTCRVVWNTLKTSKASNNEVNRHSRGTWVSESMEKTVGALQPNVNGLKQCKPAHQETLPIYLSNLKSKLQELEHQLQREREELECALSMYFSPKSHGQWKVYWLATRCYSF